MKKFIILLILLLPSCSQLSIVTSTVGVAANTSVVAKTYSGVDLITIVTTDKSIKGHIKDNIEENLTPENKESSLYIELRQDSNPINPLPWLAKQT